MGFRRARRRPENVSATPKRPKCKANNQDRSVSGSACPSNRREDTLSNDENSVDGKLRKNLSFIFDKLFMSDQVHAGVALTGRQNSHSTLAVQPEATQKLFQDNETPGTSELSPVISSQKVDGLARTNIGNPQISIEPFPSVTSSRRTSIFVGHPDHLAAPGVKTQDFALETTDGVRRQLEEGYYIAIDQTGTVRRRSLMRSVSGDDYLLARGANPRTGIVTPALHSASSSYDEEETLKARVIAPPAKWRQRGDQWVSFDLGQPTPPFSPVHDPKVHQPDRPLRVPPRLTGGKYNNANADVHAANIQQSGAKTLSRLVGPRPMKNRDQHEHEPHDSPGKYPVSPDKEDSTISHVLDIVPGLTIKRKPVGTPSKDKTGLVRRLPEESTETVIMKRPFTGKDRSSSAPNPGPGPQEPRFLSPNDSRNHVGKNLPSLPSDPRTLHFEEDLMHKDPNQSAFLGQRRPKWSENLQGYGYPITSGPGKELSCLPTSNGQSQYRLSAGVAQSAVTAENQTRKPSGPRGGNSAYPYIRKTRAPIPPRYYHITQDVNAERKIQKSLMPVPTYDNPPSQALFPPRSMRGKIVGPREMTQKRSTSAMTHSTNDIFTAPPTIMSTSTHTHIHTSMQHPRRPQIPSQMMKDYRPILDLDHILQPDYDPPHSKSQRPWNMSTNSNGPLEPLQSRPRGPPRPQMHGRADTMDNIPRASPQLNHMESCTVNRHQWRMTGMNEGVGQDRRDQSGTASVEIDRGLIPPPLRPVALGQLDGGKTRSQNGQETITIPIQIRVERDKKPSQNSGLMRRCSHCHNGYVEEQQRSIDGHIHTSEILLEEEEDDERGSGRVKSDKSTLIGGLDSSLNSLPGQRDNGDKDHSKCCPKCCITEDCHEGCLGHPKQLDHSPSNSSNTSTISAVSTSIHTKQKKLAFVKDNGRGTSPSRMRKTLRLRKIPDTKVKSQWAGPEIPIEFDSHPISPGVFWGGEGTGAIAAAKRALGLGLSPTSSARLTIGRAGTQAKGTLTEPPRGTQENESQNEAQQRNASTGKVRRHQNASKDSMRIAITGASRSQSRNTSGRSIISMRSIDVPWIGNMDYCCLLEMLFVPLEAVGMWISQHPEVRGLSWSMVVLAGEMGKCIGGTSGRVLEVAYVYSKTGRIRVRAGNMGGLMLDCGRSVVYLCIFVGVAVLFGRVLGALFGILRGVGWVLGGIGWVIKKMGLGLLW